MNDDPALIAGPSPLPAPMTEQSACDRLIVALDVDTADEANALVAALGEVVGFYKVGWQLFMGAGWAFVQSLLARDKKVFLDLKIGDIDNTVRAALNNLPDEFDGKLELLTLQGNAATVRAAKAGRRGVKPHLLMVTLLSSMDGYRLGERGHGGLSCGCVGKAGAFVRTAPMRL